MALPGFTAELSLGRGRGTYRALHHPGRASAAMIAPMGGYDDMICQVFFQGYVYLGEYDAVKGCKIYNPLNGTTSYSNDGVHFTPA